MTDTDVIQINRGYGRGLQALRRLAGIRSQEELAVDFGVSQQTLSAIESGSRPMKAHEIEWFCSYFSKRIQGYDANAVLEIMRMGARGLLVDGDVARDVGVLSPFRGSNPRASADDRVSLARAA